MYSDVFVRLRRSWSAYDVFVPFWISRIGPEKGVIHIALGAVDNALWDMYARARQKPLWKLIVDMTPVSPFTFRAIAD